MQVLGFILLLLLDVRAHIPNQPSFGSGPTRVPSGAPPVRLASSSRTCFQVTISTPVFFTASMNSGSVKTCRSVLPVAMTNMSV